VIKVEVRRRTHGCYLRGARRVGQGNEGRGGGGLHRWRPARLRAGGGRGYRLHAGPAWQRNGEREKGETAGARRPAASAGLAQYAACGEKERLGLTDGRLREPSGQRLEERGPKAEKGGGFYFLFFF
jgi:hypothetical protein